MRDYAILLLSGALFSLLPLASSHAMMCTPRQRAAYSEISRCNSAVPAPENAVIDFCPHCLNGDGVGTVAANLPPSGWSVYDPISDFESSDRAGICGDAKGNNEHMIGGRFMPFERAPIVQRWEVGATVDFVSQIDTNHNGFYEFFLCNMDTCGSTDISKKCFEEGHCYRLERVRNDMCENPGPQTYQECGPIDPQYPGRWYVPCRKTGPAGTRLVGGPSGTMRYRLPQGLRCEWCVLQWYYATGNSCAPRGFLDYFERFNNPFGSECESDGGGRGAYRPNMAECGGNRVPEEFWTCTDVAIGGGNGEDRDNNSDENDRSPTVTPSATPSESLIVDDENLEDSDDTTSMTDSEMGTVTPSESPTVTMMVESPQTLTLSATVTPSPRVSTSPVMTAGGGEEVS